MDVNIAPDWAAVLNNELEKPYFNSLINFVSNEYIVNTCYPPANQIFSAFDYASFSHLKVVIIGQDPYHGKGQANGLCFSVNKETPHPPSLKNILKEVSTNCNIPYPKNGNLERWAKQGVLLLNATLTVRAGEAGSHQKKGWERFTDAVIRKISEEKNGIVFLLWGGFANKKSNLIDANMHVILKSGHPSPLSANRGYWFGNEHFIKTNTFLKSIGKNQIDWK